MIEIKQVDEFIWRGPRPKAAEDFEQLAKLGIRIMIDLEAYILDIRGNRRCVMSEHAIASGMMTVVLPLGVLLPPSPRRLTLAVAMLAGIARAEPPELKTYVHCLQGVDRTGMVIAAHRLANGRSYDEARAEMLAAGFHRARYWWWLPTLRRYAKALEGQS